MKHRWLLALALQVLEMMAACLIQAATYAVHPALYAVGLWGLVPIAGLLSSCRAVQRGLLNYAAWLAPMPCLLSAHWLIWRFSPSASAGLLTALMSLIGAAAGEVLNQRKRPRRR